MYFLIITLYGTVTLSDNLLFHKIRHHSLHLCVCFLQKLGYILKLLTIRPDSPEDHQKKKSRSKGKTSHKVRETTLFSRTVRQCLCLLHRFTVSSHPLNHYCRQFCVVISMKKIILSKMFSKYLIKLIFRKRLEGQLIQ